MNSYVIAGGESRRMGVSKSGLMFRGETFLQHAIRVCRSAFDGVTLVLHDDSPADRAPSGVRILLDASEGRAPIFGLRRAMIDAGGGQIWILGVDHPLVSAGVLTYLSSRFVELGAEILIPVWESRPQMLCAGYSAALIEAVDDQIRRRDYALTSLIPLARTATVNQDELTNNLPDEKVDLVNVNTPGVYEELRRKYE